MSARPVAVVTGAASGVGAASAARLARAGASVVVVDVDEGNGARVADEIGGRFVALDVGDPAAWGRLAAELRSADGVSWAHLNAGLITAPEELPFLETPVERSLALVRANLDGVVLGTRVLAPLMIERGGGSIVATASLAGLIPYGGDPVYAATKHGVVGFVRSVAPQLRRAGVRIHAICPGGIETPMVAGARKASADAHQQAFLDPDAVAEEVERMLSSDDAGLVRYIAAGEGVQTIPTPHAPSQAP
jgi:NAD(P)-dependent dehydrogenase (short-subunit alcohol dehydrogenase family)